MYFAVFSVVPENQEIILKVYQEDNDKYIEVPVTPESTCNDVIACVQEPGDQSCSIIQKWKEHEYALRDYERPYEILQHWGDFQDEIKFYLRYGPSATSSPIFPDGEATQVEGRRSRSRNNMRDPSTTANTGLPGGVDLTLSELQDMAARQQQQIENQQQILVAKEQRLKYLKQQEQRQQHITAENERLKKLRDRVESQEMKLKKLRALRGEVEKHQNTNGNLNSELESVKALFNEKEKELALAVSKVEQLTQQLEEIKKEKSNITNGDKQNATAVELDKLRRELMLRNKLNEQQNSKLIVHRDMLNQRKDEMSKMDKRIQELQQRLKKKKAQQAELKKNQSNQKLDNKMPGRPAGTNIAAVEPYIQHVPKENTNDDVANKPGFAKFNPKYQSLPSNVRVTNPDKNSALENSDKSKNSEQNNNKENYQIPLVVKVDSSNGKAIQNGVSPSELSESLKKAAQRHQNNSLENSSSNNELSRKTPPPLPVRSGTTTLTHLAPRPFGSTYSTSVLTNRTQEQNMAHNVNIHEDVRTGGSGQSSPASSDSSQKDGNINIFPNKNNNHSTDQSQYNLPNSVSNNSNNEKHVNGANSKSNKPGQQKIHPSPQSNENSSLPSNKSHGATQNASGHSSVPLDEVDSSHPIKSPVDTGPKKVSKHPVANNNQLPSYEKAVKNRNINLSPTSGDNSKQNLNISDASTSSSNSDTSNGSKKTPTVRYASKNVIANTYMGKLGPEALAKYQSLNMLYKNFLPSSADGPVPGKHENKTDTSTDSSQSLSPPEYTSRNDQQSSQPSYLQKIPPRWQAGGVPTSPLDIQHPDIPSDKVSHNHQKTPKTLRRRHSDSDNEDISKLIHKYVDRHSPKKHDGGHYQRSNGQDTQATSFKDQIPEKVLVDDMGNLMDIPENVENSEQDNSNNNHFSDSSRIPTVQSNTPVVLRKKKTNLRRERSVSSGNRVSFDPLALLLDASLEGEVELVKKCATQVENVSESNDEGITALHNAICAGHYDIVTFLVEFGCDANSPDSDGWTPLHCAASCNNLPMVKFLVEHGACIFATTISDHETAAEKCEEDEDGFDGCSEYLYSIQEKLGILNNGVVYAVFDYQAQNSDELDFNIGDEIVVLRKGDELEKEWWWSRLRNKEGYIPRNLLGLYPRVLPQSRNNSDS